MLEKQKANVKDTWEILNEVINKRKNKPTYPEYFLENHKNISKKEDVAVGNVSPNLAKPIILPKIKTIQLFMIT